MKPVYYLDYRGKAGPRRRYVWAETPPGVASVRVAHVETGPEWSRITVLYSIRGKEYKKVIPVKSRFVRGVRVVKAWQ